MVKIKIPRWKFLPEVILNCQKMIKEILSTWLNLSLGSRRRVQPLLINFDFSRYYHSPEELANQVLQVFYEGKYITYPIDPFKLLKEFGIVFQMRNFDRLEGIYIGPAMPKITSKAQVWYGHRWKPVAPILLGQWSHFSHVPAFW